MNTELIVTGRVKWFNAVKGFGFVVSDASDQDILLHINVLRNFGHGAVTQGTVVELVAQQSPRGMQAIEILSIEPAEDDETGAAFPHSGPDQLEEQGSLEPARVKWFDKTRGFGFANVFGKPDDVFLHMEVLRRCSLAELQSGEAVCLRVTDGPRGKMATEIRPWEAGILSRDEGSEPS